MNKIVKAVATVAGIAAVGWAMRDRFFSIASPKEPEPPRFRVVPMADTGDGDDLTTIRGIGPVFAARLNAAGYRTLASLAGTDPQVLADAAGVTLERAEDWASQATSLHV